MDKTEKENERFVGDSDLMKAVRLLEENGFYVVHADTENYRRGDYPAYTGAILLRAYPKRVVAKTGLL